MRPDDGVVSLPTSSEFRRPLDALFPETPIDLDRLNREGGSCCCLPPAVVTSLVFDEGLPSPSLFLGPYLFFK